MTSDRPALVDRTRSAAGSGTSSSRGAWAVHAAPACETPALSTAASVGAWVTVAAGPHGVWLYVLPQRYIFCALAEADSAAKASKTAARWQRCMGQSNEPLNFSRRDRPGCKRTCYSMSFQESAPSSSRILTWPRAAGSKFLAFTPVQVLGPMSNFFHCMMQPHVLQRMNF